MIGKKSRSPTISVSPPQTPDSSDPFQYSLPMSGDSNILLELQRKYAELQKQVAELFTIVGKLTRPDIFDKLVDALNSQGVQSVVEIINSYDNEDTISKEVLGVTASNAEEGLDTLVAYLKVKDDLRLDGLFIDLFSRLESFALKEVISSNKKLSGTTNEFLRTHILRTSDQYSTLVEPSFELFDDFVRTHHPKFAHFKPLLISNYETDGQQGEPRASKMVSDKLDHALAFINRHRDSENKLRVLEQFLIGKNRVDFAVLKIMEGFLFLETKETLRLKLGDIDGMESLPKSLNPVLKQGFGYSFKSGVPKFVVTDGVMYILIDILVGDFFRNQEEFEKSHIVPYQFQIMHFRSAIFNRGFINWILEAEQTSESRIKKMGRYYRRTQQKKAKMGYLRNLPKRTHKYPK